MTALLHWTRYAGPVEAPELVGCCGTAGFADVHELLVACLEAGVPVPAVARAAPRGADVEGAVVSLDGLAAAHEDVDEITSIPPDGARVVVEDDHAPEGS